MWRFSVFNMGYHLRRAGDKNTNSLLLFAITPFTMQSQTTPYQGRTRDQSIRSRDCLAVTIVIRVASQPYLVDYIHKLPVPVCSSFPNPPVLAAPSLGFL